jgi:large subunit ribosomal protein L6
MSRLGKLPIILPEKVEAKVSNNSIIVKGPKGELRLKIHDAVIVEADAKEIKVSVKNPDIKKEKALWGLFWNLIKNMVIGVKDGYEKKLELIGVGYKVSAAGNKLNLSLGFSHPVEFILPEGISAVTAANIITLTGIDKQLVGETAARVRRLKKPEPYKGKGIKYVGEIIRRKEGKAASKGK